MRCRSVKTPPEQESSGRLPGRAASTALAPLLGIGLELLLEGGELGEWRVGVGDATAPLGRVTPFARFVSTVLEIAPAFATRTAILPVAIGAVAAPALALLRATFALLFGPVATFRASAASMGSGVYRQKTLSTYTFLPPVEPLGASSRGT